MSSDGRNTLSGIAGRVHKNLDFITAARNTGADVHVVTQLLLSLLGLIVFPVQALREQNPKGLKSELLADLETRGWPRWTFSNGGSSNLRDLLFHVRNAVSHHRLNFSSDSRNIEDVEITFRDRSIKATQDHWEAHIPAKDLQRFVELLSDFLAAQHH